MKVSKQQSHAAGEGSASALLNGLAVLRSFSSDEPALGVSEVAERVGLHKSSVSRILAALEREDLVDRDPLTRKFRLGLGVIALAGPLLSDLDVRRVAYPVLQELRAQTEETSALMVWNGSEAVCVEQVPSRRLIKHTTPLGTRYNTSSSASVRVFLASGDEGQMRELLSSGAMSYAGGAELTLDRYLTELRESMRIGYMVNYGETSVDEVGVSSPVNDHRGDVVAAVLVSAPRYRTSRDQAGTLGEACAQAARRITSRLGGVGHAIRP